VLGDVAPGVVLLARALLGDEEADRLDDGPGVGRVEESDGREEVLELEEALERVLLSAFGGDRPQSDLPLVAAFDVSWQ
jgi:hypothetical protein